MRFLESFLEDGERMPDWFKCLAGHTTKNPKVVERVFHIKMRKRSESGFHRIRELHCPACGRLGTKFYVAEQPKGEQLALL